MKHFERIDGFVSAIWEWYATHKRDLPWRDMPVSNETERAYRVLVSEVMLQQTQVARVKIVFRNFLEQFPSIQDLASATNKDVILAWRGMGYNSRALRLRDACRIVVEKYQGKFPKEFSELLDIKGIGPYTAAAICNFAFNIPTPCIDVNIRRILHRTFFGPENGDGTWEVEDKKLLRIAEAVLEGAISKQGKQRMQGKQRCDAANWHAALMDYGSLVQTKSNPKWEQCILTERGIMKTTKILFEKKLMNQLTNKPVNLARREPGRYVGSKYTPNRIFRGKIVESLRDHHAGLTAEEIGRNIAIDWNRKEHEDWLKNLITKLVQEEIIARRGKRFVLAE